MGSGLSFCDSGPFPTELAISRPFGLALPVLRVSVAAFPITRSPDHARSPDSYVIRNRQRNNSFAAGAVAAVGELEHAAVGLGDLAAEDQADAAAAVLGSEERHEKIVTVEQAGTFVADEEFNTARIGAPAHFDRACMFERGIERGVDSVANQIYEQLLDLVRVGVDGNRRAFQGFYRQAALQRGCALHQGANVHAGARGRRHTR